MTHSSYNYESLKISTYNSVFSLCVYGCEM